MRRSAAVVVAAALLAAGGCTGGDEVGPAEPPATSGTTPEEALTAPPTAPSPTAGSAPTGSGPPATTTPPVDSPTPTPGGAAPPAPGAPATRPVGEPTAAVSTAPPADRGEEAQLSDGLVVTVAEVGARDVAATEPGDVAGAAAVVEVSARNGSDEAVDLSGLVVTASLPGGAPAPPTDAGPAEPLAGSLAPGGRASGSYVFRLGDGSTEDLSLQISSPSSTTVVVVQP